MSLTDEQKQENENWHWSAERGWWAYPKWIEREKAKRAQYPEPLYCPTSITIKFLTPSGEEKHARYYFWEKGPMRLEDLPRAIRLLEDRYMIEIFKTSILERAIEEDWDEKDLGTIRQYLQRRKARIDEEKRNANTKQKTN